MKMQHLWVPESTWKKDKKQSAAFEKLTLKYFNSTSKNQKQRVFYDKSIYFNIKNEKKRNKFTVNDETFLCINEV